MDKPPQPKIAIVGLGYVGLPLSLQFAHSGVQVLGLDIDPDKAERTQQGPELHQACPSDMVAEQVNAHCLAATTDFTRAREVEAVIICIPGHATPVGLFAGISLSLTNRSPAEVLVVEGWIGKNGVRGAVAHFRNGLPFLKEVATFPWI